MKSYPIFTSSLLASCLLLNGCARVKGPSPEFQQEINTYVTAKDRYVQGMHESLYIEGERNAVLNFNRLGWLNLVYGDFDEAEWAFDQSLQRIETIYADDPQAEAAKSKFNEEDIKDYKGEPYERAMAYYYRGLLYLIKGDYENARASFKMGEFQDTLSNTEQFQSDFALLNYLQGWASKCNGNQALAEQAFGYAKEYNSDLTIPAPEHRLLMLFDSGSSPLKVASGKYQEVLQFAQGTPDDNDAPIFFVQFNHREKTQQSGNEEQALAIQEQGSEHTEALADYQDAQVLQDNVFFLDDAVPVDMYTGDEPVIEIQAARPTNEVAEQQVALDSLPSAFDQVEIFSLEEDEAFPEKRVVASIDMVSAVDVFSQASTRGGRPIQGILDGKAQFKSTTGTVGKVSSVLGAATTIAGLAGGNNIATGVGLGLQVVGALAGAISNATTPKADTRYWDTLPNAVYLSTFSLPDGAFLIKVGNKDQDLVDNGIYGNVLGGDERCTVFWATTMDPDLIPKSSPKARLSWQEMAGQDDEVIKNDEFFRKSLLSHQPTNFN